MVEVFDRHGRTRDKHGNVRYRDYNSEIKKIRTRGGGSYRTEVVTVGGSMALANMETIMPSIKKEFSRYQRNVLKNHFVKPVKRDKTLIRRSKKPKKLDKKYARGKWWPRVYTEEPLKKRAGRFSARVKYNKPSAERNYNYIFHRRPLYSQTRVARAAKRQPWNHAAVLWGNRWAGVGHAGFLIQSRGDFRTDALNKFGGNVTREISKLYRATMAANARKAARVGLHRGLDLAGLKGQQRKYAHRAVKEKNKSRYIERELALNENKDIASLEKDLSLETYFGNMDRYARRFLSGRQQQIDARTIKDG